MNNFGDYLIQMVSEYANITRGDEKKEIYVARWGDSVDGDAIIFALPYKERIIDANGNVFLTDEDLRYLKGLKNLDTSFGLYKLLEDRKGRLQVLTSPQRNDTIDLEHLKEVSSKGWSHVFYDRTDLH